MVEATRMGGERRRRRVEKRCKLCKHSTNSPDPVNRHKLLRWGYGNRGKVDVSTGEESMQGKLDHYCEKVSASVFCFSFDVVIVLV